MVLIDLHWFFFTYWKSMGTSNWRWTIPLKVIYAAHYTAIMWHLNRICDEKEILMRFLNVGVLYHTAVRLNASLFCIQEKEILSSFTQVVPNLYELLSSTEHKDDILRNANNWTGFSPHWRPYYFFPFLPNILFYIQQNKEAHTGL